MKLECEKSKIESAIQMAARLTGKHLTLPVLSCVFLEASSDGELTVKATNLDMGVEIKTKAKVSKGGSLAVPAGVLVGVLSSIKESKLTFEDTGSNLKVYSEKSSAVIKCLPPEDFPSIPKLKNSKTVKINSKDLVHGFKSVWYSASNSNIKPELSSVYIYRDDGNLVFVSTDSFRLAEKKINTKIESDFPQTLIPYKNVMEITKILEDHKGDVNIIFEKNQAAFIINGTYMVSRLIDGSFPDYKQIIPKSFGASATILKDDLINAAKASNVFSDTLNQVKIKVDVKNKSLNIEAKSNEIGEYKESIAASVSGENVELNFNNRYIMDCMQSIASDSINLSFGGLGKPLAVSGASDKSFLYIVMPMNR